MGARLRVQNEQAEKLRLENQIVRAETLNRTELERALTELADALVGVVKNSNLDRRSQEDFLHNLASWPVLLQETAAAQSRLPNGKDSAAEV